FWLERHMMFRHLMAQMQADTERFLDEKLSPDQFGGAVSRNGGLFVNQLHGHHQIEDHHYFPLLRLREPRIEAGFDLLDADHQALDGILNGFVQQANGALQAARSSDAALRAGELHEGLLGLQRNIGRHLEDEEDLIVPVLLEFGSGGLG
ncbi:hemerythrin domain-containing protein, partial [Cribrihabitans sp. XS_ASV171]